MSAITCSDPPRLAGGRRWLALLAVGLLVLPGGVVAGDTDTAEEADTLVIRALLTDHNPFVPGARRTTFHATILLRGRDVRVDLRGPAGQRGLLLHDGEAATGWLADLDGQVAVPVPTAGEVFSRLIVDPRAPCAGFGVRCDPGLPRYIAGKSRKGYVFRDAVGRGPGGLGRGEFWVDDEHGVVVAYRGVGRGAREAPAMEADLVQLQRVRSTDFNLPDVVQVAQ